MTQYVKRVSRVFQGVQNRVKTEWVNLGERENEDKNRWTLKRPATIYLEICHSLSLSLWWDCVSVENFEKKKRVDRVGLSKWGLGQWNGKGKKKEKDGREGWRNSWLFSFQKIWRWATPIFIVDPHCSLSSPCLPPNSIHLSVLFYLLT